MIKPGVVVNGVDSVDEVDGVDGVDLNGRLGPPAQPPPSDTPTLRALSSSLR